MVSNECKCNEEIILWYIIDGKLLVINVEAVKAACCIVCLLWVINTNKKGIKNISIKICAELLWSIVHLTDLFNGFIMYRLLQYYSVKLCFKFELRSKWLQKYCYRLKATIPSIKKHIIFIGAISVWKHFYESW